MPSPSLLVLIGLLFGLATISNAKPATTPTSHLPSRDIEQFIVQKLDLSTFRNSLGPRRQPGMRLFSDFGLQPRTQANGIIEFQDAEWYYKVKVLGRGDYNWDGLEDLMICFTDQSLQGTYRTDTPLLVTRYSKDGLLIAVAYEIDHDSCGKSRR